MNLEQAFQSPSAGMEKQPLSPEEESRLDILMKSNPEIFREILARRTEPSAKVEDKTAEGVTAPQNVDSTPAAGAEAAEENKAVEIPPDFLGEYKLGKVGDYLVAELKKGDPETVELVKRMNEVIKMCSEVHITGEWDDDSKTHGRDARIDSLSTLDARKLADNFFQFSEYAYKYAENKANSSPSSDKKLKSTLEWSPSELLRVFQEMIDALDNIKKFRLVETGYGETFDMTSMIQSPDQEGINQRHSVLKVYSWGVKYRGFVLKHMVVDVKSS